MLGRQQSAPSKRYGRQPKQPHVARRVRTPSPEPSPSSSDDEIDALTPIIKRKQQLSRSPVSPHQLASARYGTGQLPASPFDAPAAVKGPAHAPSSSREPSVASRRETGSAAAPAQELAGAEMSTTEHESPTDEDGRDLKPSSRRRVVSKASASASNGRPDVSPASKRRRLATESSSRAPQPPATPPKPASRQAKPPNSRGTPARDLSDIFDSIVPDSRSRGSPVPSPGRSEPPSPSPRRQLAKSLSARSMPDSPSASPARQRSPPGRMLGTSYSLPAAFEGGRSSLAAEPGGSPSSQRQLFRSPSGIRTSNSTAGSNPGRSGGGARRTYGGGARSFKRDMVEEQLFVAPPPMPTLRSEDDDDAKPAETPSSSAARKMLPKLPVLKERETYASFRAKWGLDQEEADEQDNEAASELRSLSQLRSKGESDRFLDDFNYLVEGLDLEMPLSVRRSTAIEVLRRLCEPDTMRKLKATGFIEKVYLDFRRAEAGNGDRVLDSALIFLVALMSRDQRVAEALLRVDCTEVAARENAALDNATGSDMLAVTSRLLRRPWAVDEVGTRERPRGTSEADAKSLRSLRSVIDASPLKHDDTIVPSVMSLALLTLSIISSQPPRQLFSPQKHIALSGVLGSVANFLCDTGVSIKRRLKAYESGMDLPPVDDAVDVGCIDLALRTCEACLAADEESHFVLADNAERLLAWICELILFCTATLAHGASQPAQECLIGALKVLVELTSSTAEWNAALSGDARALWSLLVLVAPSRYEQAHVSDDATTFDILCLALSTLTNVCETSASAREHLRNFDLSPTCRQARKCLNSCVCKDRQRALKTVLRLYTDPVLPAAAGEVEKAFVHGYSAILIGLLMLESEEDQALVRSALKGARSSDGSSPGALSELAESLDQFAQLHEQTDRLEDEQAAQAAAESEPPSNQADLDLDLVDGAGGSQQLLALAGRQASTSADSKSGRGELSRKFATLASALRSSLL